VVEVCVVVQQDKATFFGCRGYQQVGNLASFESMVCEEALDLPGSAQMAVRRLNKWAQGHRVRQPIPFTAIARGESNLEIRDPRSGD
jgi:hypothetical protein